MAQISRWIEYDVAVRVYLPQFVSDDQAEDYGQQEILAALDTPRVELSVQGIDSVGGVHSAPIPGT